MKSSKPQADNQECKMQMHELMATRVPVLHRIDTGKTPFRTKCPSPTPKKAADTDTLWHPCHTEVGPRPYQDSQHLRILQPINCTLCGQGQPILARTADKELTWENQGLWRSSPSSPNTGALHFYLATGEVFTSQLLSLPLGRPAAAQRDSQVLSHTHIWALPCCRQLHYISNEPPGNYQNHLQYQSHLLTLSSPIVCKLLCETVKIQPPEIDYTVLY